MLPVLQAEETLGSIAVVAVGSATMEERRRQAFLIRLERMANKGGVGEKRLSPEQTAAIIGIKVIKK